MSEWASQKIGTLIHLITKGTTPNKAMGGFSESGINYIKSESISYDGRIDNSKFAFITLDVHEQLKRSQLQKDDILFSMAGAYLGKSAIVKEEFLPANTNQALAIIRLDQSKAYPKFINYFFRHPNVIDYVNNLSGQSAQPNINFEEIKSIEIGLPPLPEQKAIASVLSSLDDKIDLMHRQNKTLEAMAETLFRQWFIEEAKEDWEYVELGSVVETSSGGTPSRKEMSYYKDGTISWVKSKELNGSFITETEEMITEEAVKKSSAKLLPAYSTLIAMYGATVGEYALITKPMTCNQAICAVKENDNYPYTFIFMYVKNQKDELINQAVGSAQQNISQILIKKLLLPTCTDRIKEYHQLVNAWFSKIRVNVEQIQTLENLRDTLLPKLMSGEVRVHYQTKIEHAA